MFREPSKDAQNQSTADPEHDSSADKGVSLPAIEKHAEHDTKVATENAKEHQHDRNVGIEDTETVFDKFASTAKRTTSTTSTDHNRGFQQQNEFEVLSLNLREKERRKRGLRAAFLPSIQLVLTETIEPEVEKLLVRMAENSQGGLTSDPDVLANLCEDFITRCGAAATSLFIRSSIDGTPSEFRELVVDEGLEALLRAAEERFGKGSEHLSVLKSIVEKRRARLETQQRVAIREGAPSAAPIRMIVEIGAPELRQPSERDIEFKIPVDVERIITAPPAGIEVGLFRDEKRPLTPSEVIAARIIVESLYREWEQTAVRIQGRKFSQYVIEYLDSRAITNKVLRAYFIDTGTALDEREESDKQLGRSGLYSLRATPDLKLRDSNVRLPKERNISSPIDLFPQLKTDPLETSLGVSSPPMFSNGWIDSILSQFRAGKHRDSEGRPDAEVIAVMGIIADRAACPHPPSAAEMERIRNWQQTEFSGLVREEIRSMIPELAARYGSIDPELLPILVCELERAFESLGRGAVPAVVIADRSVIEGTHPYLEREKKRSPPSETTSTANLLLETGTVAIGHHPEFFERALANAARAAIQGPPANVRHPSEIANDLIRILAIPEKQQALFKSRVVVGLQSAIKKEGNEFLKKHASDIRTILAGRRGAQHEGRHGDIGSQTEVSPAQPLPTHESGTASFAVTVLYRVKTAIAEQSNTDAIAAQKITRTIVADSLKEYGSSLQNQVKKFLAEDDLEGLEKLLYRAAIDRQILLPESASQEVLAETDAAIRELMSSWQKDRVQQQAGGIADPVKDIRTLLAASSADLLFKMPEVLRGLDSKSFEQQRTLFRSAEACRAAAAELKRTIARACDVNVRRSGETVRQVPMLVVDGEALPNRPDTRIGLESRQLVEVTDATTLPDIACALFELPTWEHLAPEHFFLLRESFLQGSEPGSGDPALEKLAVEAERCAVLAGERSLVQADNLSTIRSGALLPIGSTVLGARLRSQALESSRALLLHASKDQTDKVSTELSSTVDKEIVSGVAHQERIATFAAIGRAVAVTMSERPIGDPLRELQDAEKAIDHYLEKFPQEAKHIKIRLAAIHLMAGKKITSAIDGSDNSTAARQSAHRAHHHFTRAIELATGNTGTLTPEVESGTDAAAILTIVHKAALSRGEIVSLFPTYDLKTPAGSPVQVEQSLATLDQDLDLASRGMLGISKLSNGTQDNRESLQVTRHLLRSRVLERSESMRGSDTVNLEGRAVSAEEEFYAAIDVMLGLPPSVEAFRGVGKVGGNGWIPCSELATNGGRDFLVNQGFGLAAPNAHRLSGILRSAPPSKRDVVIRLIYEHGREALAHNDPAKPSADALSKAFAATQLLDGANDPRAKVYGDLLYADFVLNTGGTYKVNPWLIDIFAGVDIKRDVLGTRPTKGELIDRALDISTVLAETDLVSKRYKEEIVALASKVDAANDGEAKTRLIEQARELERQVNENELFANEAFQRQFDAYMQLATTGNDASIKEVAAAKVRELRQVYEERADARLTELDKALEHVCTIEERVPDAAGSDGLVSEKDRIFKAQNAVHERLSRMYLEEAAAFSQAGHPELAKDSMELLKAAYGEGGSRGARFAVIERLDQFSKSLGANKTAAFFQQTLAELNSQSIGEFLVYEAVGTGAGAIIGLVVTLGQPAGFFAGGMIGSGAALSYLKGRALYHGWDRIAVAGATGVTSRTAEDTLIDAVALGLDIVSLGAPIKGTSTIGCQGIKATFGIGTERAASELAEGLRLTSREILAASEAGLRHTPLTLTQWQARREIQRSALQEFLRVSGSFGGRGAALVSVGSVGTPLAFEFARIQSLDLTPEERAARYAHLISEGSKSVAAFSTFFALRSIAHRAGNKELSKTVSQYIAGLPQDLRKEMESEILTRLRQPINTHAITPPASKSEGAPPIRHEATAKTDTPDIEVHSTEVRSAEVHSTEVRNVAQEELTAFLQSEVPDDINTGSYKAAKAEIERTYLERGFVERSELAAAYKGEISVPPGKSGKPVTGAELERFLYEAAPDGIKGAQEIHTRLIERAEKRGFLYEIEISEARAGRFVPDPVVAAHERVRLDPPNGAEPGQGGDEPRSTFDDLDSGGNRDGGPVDDIFDRPFAGAQHSERIEGGVALAEPEIRTETKTDTPPKPQKRGVENKDRNQGSNAHVSEIDQILIAVKEEAATATTVHEGVTTTRNGGSGNGDRERGPSTAMHLPGPAAGGTSDGTSDGTIDGITDGITDGGGHDLPLDVFASNRSLEPIDPEADLPAKPTVSPPLEITIIEPERTGDPLQVETGSTLAVEQKPQTEEIAVTDSHPEPTSKTKPAEQASPSPHPQPQLEAQSVQSTTKTKERDAGWNFSSLLNKLEQKRTEPSEQSSQQSSYESKPKAKRHFGKKIRKAIVVSAMGARLVDESEVASIRPEPLSVTKISINEGRDE